VLGACEEKNTKWKKKKGRPSLFSWVRKERVKLEKKSGLSGVKKVDDPLSTVEEGGIPGKKKARYNAIANGRKNSNPEG